MRCDSLSVFLERTLNQRSYHFSRGRVSTSHLLPLCRTILLGNRYFWQNLSLTYCARPVLLKWHCQQLLAQVIWPYDKYAICLQYVEHVFWNSCSPTVSVVIDSSFGCQVLLRVGLRHMSFERECIILYQDKRYSLDSPG